MADFTSNFWSILIAGVTLISIAVLIYFVKALSTRKADTKDSSPETMESPGEAPAERGKRSS